MLVMFVAAAKWVQSMVFYLLAFDGKGGMIFSLINDGAVGITGSIRR